MHAVGSAVHVLSAASVITPESPDKSSGDQKHTGGTLRWIESWYREWNPPSLFTVEVLYVDVCSPAKLYFKQTARQLTWYSN